MPNSTEKGIGWKSEGLPPMLRLELRLEAHVNLDVARQALRESLAGLSAHYIRLGGIGLRYHRKQIENISPEGKLKVSLYPVEPTDTEVQRGRLKEIEGTVKAILPPLVTQVDTTVF